LAAKAIAVRETIMGTTQRVADLITGARYEDIPQPALDMAKLCLLDVIGCALYASTQPPAKMMIDLVEDLGGRAVCCVLGTALRTDALNAAMANAMTGHVEDFDDMGAGHHATLLMPVVLALGEERRSTGKEALAAYVVGFDITAYTTITLGPDHKGRDGTRRPPPAPLDAPRRRAACRDWIRCRPAWRSASPPVTPEVFAPPSAP
jgi:2-methylcitrate dehydratase PrpD